MPAAKTAIAPMRGLLRKLSEQEDDAYLQKGQITEEEICSADTDVWATDDADDILILRYGKRFSKYKRCPHCHFITCYHARTDTIRQATYNHSGLKEHIYICKNCGYKHREKVSIPKLQKSRVASAGFGGGFSSGGGSGASSWGGGRSGGGELVGVALGCPGRPWYPDLSGLDYDLL